MTDSKLPNKVTPDDVSRTIIGEHYYVIPNSTVTICALYLRNGFVVIGDSACVSHMNFDADIGRRLARQRAQDKIWELEGYLLLQRLHDGIE